MIGLDTNILVRYIAQDDPGQTRVATQLMESLTPDNPGFVSAVVLAETVWVMEDLYAADRDRVATVIETLLQARSLVVQDAELAWKALARFRRGAADFADYLIERACNAAGCDHVYTFDRKAARADDCAMRLLQRS